MCKELTDELDNARQLAVELAQHLLNMGAARASIPVQIGADEFIVTVERGDDPGDGGVNTKERLCCCIPDQTRQDMRCTHLAEYQIWSGDDPAPDAYTESCPEHLEQMLDDSMRFEVLRIPQAA